MNVLDGLPLGDLTPWGIVGIVVVLVLTGRLVPRRTLDDEIKRRERWRQAAETWQASTAEAIAQIRELHESVPLMLDLLRAIRDRADREGDR